MASKPKPSALGVKIRRSYGETEIVGFEGARRLEVYRPFTVAANEPWNREIKEYSFCVGVDDASAPLPIGSGYSSRCSYCWLNIKHTTDAHAAAIASEPAPAPAIV